MSYGGLAAVGMASSLGSAPAAISAPCAGADPDGLRVEYQRPTVVSAMNFTRAPFEASDRERVARIFTGGGKTRTAAALVRQWLAENPGDLALWVVPRIFLGDDARERLQETIGAPVALERAEYKASTAVRVGATRCVVGSMQTLVGDRLLEWEPGTFGLIVWDECQTWDGDAAARLKARFPRARLVGLSATPTTGKLLPVGPDAKGFDVLWGIENGYFVPPTPIERNLTGIDVSKLVSRRGSSGVKDLPIGELELEIAKNAKFIVDAILSDAADRHHRLIYTPGVASAHAIANLLCKYENDSAVSTDAKTPAKEREQTLVAFNEGRIRSIVNCGIYLYGLDVPRCDCITIARLTEDTNLWKQMVGRGGRPAPGIGELATRQERIAAIAASSKPDFLLLILSGQAGQHSLCTTEDLDDEVTPEIKARARSEREANPRLTVWDALKDAKAWQRGEFERIARAAMDLKIQSLSGPFDPFRAAGIGNREAYNRIANHEPGPASDKMRGWLRSQGLDPDISQGEGRKLRAKAETWDRDGRATFSQRGKLAAKGLPHDLSWKQAAELLFAAQTTPGGIPPRGVVERIIEGRAPGEEG